MITIIDYGAGNHISVQKILNKLGVENCVTDQREEIERATKLILPGVGHFAAAMQMLNSSDLIDVLNHKVLNERTPILGICLGMQLMAKFSDEGKVSGLGWIDANCYRFDKTLSNLKIPHVGWNSLNVKKPSILTDSLNENHRFYFTHSYYLSCNNPEDCLAETVYGNTISSMIQKNNIYGTQFHPEKSHHDGFELLKRFAEFC